MENTDVLQTNVMPQEKIIQQPTGNSKNSIIVLGIVFVLLLLIGIAAFVIYKSYSGNTEIGLEQVNVANVSKDEIIKKFGTPLQDADTFYGKALLYKSSIPTIPNSVIYNATDNQIIGVLLNVEEEGQKNKYQEMVKRGAPEKVMYSTYQSGFKVYIFASTGITYTASEINKTVIAIHKYAPTTLENYLSLYGRYYSEKNILRY